MNRTTPLLCIDTNTMRVRRYEFIFDRVRATSEFEVPTPQPSRAELTAALDMIRKTPGMTEAVFA